MKFVADIVNAVVAGVRLASFRSHNWRTIGARLALN
jgi:hypothetical protein